MKSVTAVTAVTLVVDRCGVDDDLSPPFHHCDPLLPPASGRRSRRGGTGTSEVSTDGLRPCSGRSTVEDGVDRAGGGGGGGGVHKSAGGAGGRRRSKSSSSPGSTSTSLLLSVSRGGGGRGGGAGAGE